MLYDKEHYDLMAAFERQYSGRFDREDKSLWPKGAIYQDGHVNNLFLAFRRGYSYAKSDQALDRNVAYGDGYNAGLSKGFQQGYDEALADVRLELDGVVDAAISKLEQGRGNHE